MADSNASRAPVGGAQAGAARGVFSLGRLVLGLLFLQLFSGAALLWFFRAGPEAAWVSLVDLRELSVFAWLRPFHRWASQATLLATVLYLLVAFLDGTYRAPSRVGWVYDSALLGLILLLAGSGFFLPVDRAAIAAAPRLTTWSSHQVLVLHAFLLPAALLALLVWRRWRWRPGGRRRVALVGVAMALLLVATVGQRARSWRQVQSRALEFERADLAERLAMARAGLDLAQIEQLKQAEADQLAGLESQRPEIDRLRAERRSLAGREQRATGREREALRELIAYRDQRLQALHAGVEAARRELALARQPAAQLAERLAATAPPWELRFVPRRFRPWVDRRLAPRQIVANGIFRSPPQQRIERVDRCQTCHLGIADATAQGRPAPFAAHPDLDLYLGPRSPHRLTEVGCTVCHGGEGLATDFSRAGHRPRNTEQASEWRQRWGWRSVAGGSPNSGSVIRVDDQVQAGCVACHAAAGEVPGAEVWQQGRRAVEERACGACHGGAAETGERPHRGPPLDRLARKTSVGWIERWLATAPGDRAATSMPHSLAAVGVEGAERQVQVTEGRALATYLWESSRGKELPAPPPGDAAAGARLYATIGCAACHEMAAPPRVSWSTAPLLLGDGPQASAGKLNAGWLYAWLLRPAELDPGTQMPDMRLSAGEAADLTAFLLAKAPTATPARAPIDTETRDLLLRAQLEDEFGLEAGQARFEELAEHDRTLYLGRRTAASHGCAACHSVPAVESPPEVESLAAIVARLAPDRDAGARLRAALEAHGERTNGGDLGLAGPLAKAVVVYLMGLEPARVDPRQAIQRTRRVEALAVGRQLVERFGCRACHQLEGRGGLGEDSLRLDIAGHRTRSRWLFDYLSDPSRVTIRPRLEMRMPTYGFDGATGDRLVAYFAALAGRPVMESPPPTPSRRELAVGAAVYRMLQCDGCHGTEESAKPLYRLAPDRLRQQWVEELILDPQRWLPGSDMPTAFAKLDGGGHDASFLPAMLGAPLFADTRLRLARVFDDPAEMEAHLSDAQRVARSLAAHLRHLQR